MDASAVPHFRNGGLSAAAQTFGARGRQTRGDAATMVDVTAGQGTTGGNGFPSLGEIGAMLKQVKVGDKVQFEAEEAGKGYTVTRLQKSR